MNLLIFRTVALRAAFGLSTNYVCGLYSNLRYTLSEKEYIVKPNKYGVVIKVRTAKQRPVPMDLSGEQGTRLVLTTAKRVMATHAKVIKALAHR